MATEPSQPRRSPRSLRRTVAFAFVPLVLAVSGAGVCQFLLARRVHLDVQRLFEELREVALVRALVDELRGVEQWVQTVPDARPESHPLVFRDVRQHHASALSMIARFAVPDDPSSAHHDRTEGRLLLAAEQPLRLLASALERGDALADLAKPLTAAHHAAATLAATIEHESREIGDALDHRSDEMAQFLLALGVASVATIGGLGWLLLRRVLQPLQELRAASMRLGHGELATAIGPFRDTELDDLATTLRTMADSLQEHRNELEARVEQRSREVLRSARLAQLGTLAAGIAHEINNPLASIVAAAEGLLRDADRAGHAFDQGTREYLQILRKEALRARDITARLLRFSRHDEPRREPVMLADEVREVAALFAHQLQDAGVHLDVGGDAGATIVGDPAEWRQVLFNLLRNALDASPRGGAIRVRVQAQGDVVQLIVADDGPGVPPDRQDRVFEPFFTTKEAGQGTGLGLAIVHRIVDAHGGRIRVANGEAGGRGACFTITLPAVP